MISILRKLAVISLSLGPGVVLAQQTNYVVTTPNASSPGIYNTLVGPSSGTAITTGTENSFFGYRSGSANTTGSSNVFIGSNSGKSNTTGDFNLFVGNFAGQANTTGRENLYFGSGSGFSNTTGRFNTFVGLNSGYSNTLGENNVFFGQRAGFSNTTGNYNLFFGAEAGYSNVDGVYNTVLGNGAGRSNTSGTNNTLVGLNGGFKTTGSDNVALGASAGFENISGTRNTFIGTAAGVTAGNPGLTNATAIGYGALVSSSNSLILGNSSVNVGIGNTAPGNKLEITSGLANKSGLRFSNLSSSSSALLSLQINLLNPIVKVLTVDANGDVVLAGLGLNLAGLRAGAPEPDTWTINTQTSTVQSVNDNPVSIGGGINRMPVGYKLFVAGGILTEKVKVAVKNSDEWADYVFADTYKLRSLKEVESFVKVNKHLPGVPSAEQVAKDGIDVGKMDAKLLEKIEELTLYLIEQRKELESVRAQNNQMKERMSVLEAKSNH